MKRCNLRCCSASPKQGGVKSRFFKTTNLIAHLKTNYSDHYDKPVSSSFLILPREYERFALDLHNNLLIPLKGVTLLNK